MHPIKKTFSKEDLLKEAAAFHGHVGPFLVLGLKAGELANAILEKDPFRMTAEIFCPLLPPQSCIIDGIQFSTGCTMGKGNIFLHACEPFQKIIFSLGEKKVEIRLKQSTIEKLKTLKEKGPEELGKELYGMGYALLFDYSIK